MLKSLSGSISPPTGGVTGLIVPVSGGGTTGAGGVPLPASRVVTGSCFGVEEQAASSAAASIAIKICFIVFSRYM